MQWISRLTCITNLQIAGQKIENRKISADQCSEFCNMLMKSWLQDNDIEVIEKPDIEKPASF